MRNANKGFTLIEVMVAVAIFAAAAGAIVMANTTTLQNTRLIEQQIEGRWVNQNMLTQLRIEEQLPDAGVINEEQYFNGSAWKVEITVRNVETDIIGPYLRRITLKATQEGDDYAADVLEAVLGEAS